MSTERRRYQVFLSSTSQELSGARRALLDSTIRCGHFPSSMDLLTAGTERDLNIIEKLIRDADIFVILVGSRFGSEAKCAEGKHFVELEYQFALKYEKPILAFLMNEKEYERRRRALPRKDHERSHKHDLPKFREEVKQHLDGTGRIVQFFGLGKGGLHELERSYEQSLTDAVRGLQGRGGWIRSEEYDALDRILAQNPFFRRFVTRLNEFNVLSARVAEKCPKLKRAIADYFLDRYLGRIVDLDVCNLFFESGSSVAFVAEAFIARLQKEKWLENFAPRMCIQTNNILVYLDLLLSARVRFELFPYGPPEGKFGATFGPLADVTLREPPEKSGERLCQSAAEVVSSLSDDIRRRYSRHGLLFTSVSGLELATKSNFIGPHVSSYYNKLFKRALFEARCPTVMFLDETKVPKTFSVGHCYPVCGPEFSWRCLCKEVPLAMSIAAGSEARGIEIEEVLKTVGLCNAERELASDGTLTLIASNERFRVLWKEDLLKQSDTRKSAKQNDRRRSLS